MVSMGQLADNGSLYTRRADCGQLSYNEELFKELILLFQRSVSLEEIIEECYEWASTMIASQLTFASWYEFFGEETIADVILDRVVHTSHNV